MAEKLVKNGVVKMDWEARGFMMNTKIGFYAAVHDYHGVPVVFREGEAYTLRDSEGAFPMDSIVDFLKKNLKITDNKSEGYEYEELEDIEDSDEYLYLGNMAEVDDANCDAMGLTDADKKDIVNRVTDLYPYWEETEYGLDEL